MPTNLYFDYKLVGIKSHYKYFSSAALQRPSAYFRDSIGCSRDAPKISYDNHSFLDGRLFPPCEEFLHNVRKRGGFFARKLEPAARVAVDGGDEVAEFVAQAVAEVFGEDLFILREVLIAELKFCRLLFLQYNKYIQLPALFSFFCAYKKSRPHVERP